MSERHAAAHFPASIRRAQYGEYIVRADCSGAELGAPIIEKCASTLVIF